MAAPEVDALALIAGLMEESLDFEGVSYDGDHNSAEVFFTCNGYSFVLRSSAIRDVEEES